jgi:hypothetical protein
MNTTGKISASGPSDMVRNTSDGDRGVRILGNA